MYAIIPDGGRQEAIRPARQLDALVELVSYRMPRVLFPPVAADVWCTPFSGPRPPWWWLLLRVVIQCCPRPYNCLRAQSSRRTATQAAYGLDGRDKRCANQNKRKTRTSAAKDFKK
ncbi:hypothetical protein MTO96_014474 [Rhipicephalus appendiculatus]